MTTEPTPAAFLADNPWLQAMADDAAKWRGLVEAVAAEASTARVRSVDKVFVAFDSQASYCDGTNGELDSYDCPPLSALAAAVRLEVANGHLKCKPRCTCDHCLGIDYEREMEDTDEQV